MKVAVRYFASVREALGSGESVEVPAGATVGQVRDAVRCALDHVLCDETTAVGEGAEVGFFPPVTGG
jgi:molybdopterin synthase sulfur carrier subunit